ERQPEPLEPVGCDRGREKVALDVHLAADERLAEAERGRSQEQAPEGATRVKDDREAAVAVPTRAVVPSQRRNAIGTSSRANTRVRTPAARAAIASIGGSL